MTSEIIALPARGAQRCISGITERLEVLGNATCDGIDKKLQAALGKH